MQTLILLRHRSICMTYRLRKLLQLLYVTVESNILRVQIFAKKNQLCNKLIHFYHVVVNNSLLVHVII